MKILLLTLALPLLSVLQATPMSPGPEDQDWTLVELDGKPLPAPTDGGKAPTLRLNSAKHDATGSSGVNRFFGGYTREGAALSFGALAGTRMAGPREAMRIEQAYLKALNETTGWRIDSGSLLLLREDSVLARFLPAEKTTAQP